jgi:hypothetical protein
MNDAIRREVLENVDVELSVHEAFLEQPSSMSKDWKSK